MRAASIFLFGILLRFALILRFPLIFGGDPMRRMLHRNQILVSHELPLLQLIVAAISEVTHNYVAIQFAMAAIGAAVGVAFYWLARDLVDERAAFLSGLIMTTAPLVAAHSIVPFQESLMLACVLFAFHFFYSQRYIESSIWLALGCFTRYEAWIAAPVLAAAYVFKRREGPIDILPIILRGLALFGWAPAGWIVLHRGLAPQGSYVIESNFTPARLIRWVYLGYITAKFTPVIVIALALAGAWFVWRDRAKWVARLWPLMAFLAIFAVAILFSAHGELPHPERRVASREAHFLIAGVVLLAAIALERIPRYRVALASIGVALGVWGTYSYVAREASNPRLQLSYRVAKFFDRALQPGERALILSVPWDRAVFDFYLQRARETGGEAGYQAALRNLAETADMSPPDYQRMLIHSRYDRSRLVAESSSCTEWVAVWSDYSPAPQDLPLDLSAPIDVLQEGNLSVRISKRDCPR